MPSSSQVDDHQTAEALQAQKAGGFGDGDLVSGAGGALCRPAWLGADIDIDGDKRSGRLNGDVSASGQREMGLQHLILRQVCQCASGRPGLDRRNPGQTSKSFFDVRCWLEQPYRSFSVT